MTAGTGSFTFKKFTILHSRSTMKVGTDAVLLGAWTGCSNALRILDIGTGCGIVALMLAQRSEAHIDAIDIDKSSSEEASENFRNSPWSERLNSIHASLRDFAETSPLPYDLIVSNPPFFQDSLLPSAAKRKVSRHNTRLTFDAFLFYASLLLSTGGRIAVILPVKESGHFLEKAYAIKLYLYQILEIFPKAGKPANRVIMILSGFFHDHPSHTAITLWTSEKKYSDEYKRLTAEFHPFF